MAEHDTSTHPGHTAPQPSGDSPANNDNPADNNGGKRKRLLLILALVVVIVAAGYLAYWLLWGRFHITTEDAYVGGNVVSVSPR